MNSFFKELFEYNNHCNQLSISRVIESSLTVSEKTIRLQNHIVNAHQIWNTRLSNGIPYGVFEIHPLVELTTLDQQNHSNTFGMIDQLDFDAIVKYTTSRGDQFSNSSRDILFHIINHSNYHRAQIATEFKLQGIEPLTTDYIFYKRLS